MPTVRVNLANSPYNVVVEPGVLSRVGDWLASLVKSKVAVAIFDAAVVNHYRDPLLAALAGKFERVIDVPVPGGEDNKSVATVERLYDQVLRHQIDRRTPVLAVGGGVIGDTAGFVAATVLRGVPFVQIPTTLLAMVDASVGGKIRKENIIIFNLNS